jgi:hypothetical protein
MSSTLDKAARSSNGSSRPAHKNLASCFASAIQGVQTDTAAHSDSRSFILPSDHEVVRKLNFPELVRPDKKRALGGGAPEKVVPRSFDGNTKVVGTGEFCGCLFLTCGERGRV